MVDGNIQRLYREKKLRFKEIVPSAIPLRYTEPAAPLRSREKNKTTTNVKVRALTALFRIEL